MGEEIKEEVKEEVKIEPKKKEAGKGIIILSLVTLLSVIACITLTIIILVNNGEQNKKTDKFMNTVLDSMAEDMETTGSYVEDGFLVMGEFEIKSTKAISDAYISGDDSALNSEDKETLRLATDVLDKIIKDGMSDYEKEKAVFDWMNDELNHTESGSTVVMPGTNSGGYTPYGVLTSKQAVCVGFATTFRLFMHMLGIDCHIVHNESHSWNIVKIEDDWYQLDIYSSVGSGDARYAFFNLTDAEMRSSNEWVSDTLPEAKGTKYSYAVQNAVDINDRYEIPAIVKKGYDEGKRLFFFRLKDGFTSDDVGFAEEMSMQLQSALELITMQGEQSDKNIEIMDNGYMSIYIGSRFYQDKDDTFIYGIVIYEDSNNYGNNVDDETRTKINEKINEVFEIELPLEEVISDDGAVGWVIR